MPLPNAATLMEIGLTIDVSWQYVDAITYCPSHLNVRVGDPPMRPRQKRYIGQANANNGNTLTHTRGQTIQIPRGIERQLADRSINSPFETDRPGRVVNRPERELWNNKTITDGTYSWRAGGRSHTYPSMPSRPIRLQEPWNPKGFQKFRNTPNASYTLQQITNKWNTTRQLQQRSETIGRPSHRRPILGASVLASYTKTSPRVNAVRLDGTLWHNPSLTVRVVVDRPGFVV